MVSKFFIFALLFLSAWAAPAAQESQWSNTMMIQETVTSFYETVVDEVVSAHSEDLLAKTRRHGKYKSAVIQQKDRLTSILDSCVARYVGYHIHALNKQVYAAIFPILGGTLPAVWPADNRMLTEDQVASALYSLNQAVSDGLARTFDEYQLLDRVRHACRSRDPVALFGRRWIGYLLPRVISQNVDLHFLKDHLQNVRTELSKELDCRAGDLVMTIYNDLYEQELEDF